MICTNGFFFQDESDYVTTTVILVQYMDSKVHSYEMMIGSNNISI